MAIYEARRSASGDVFIVVNDSSPIETQSERSDPNVTPGDHSWRSGSTSRVRRQAPAPMSAGETRSVINAICALIVIGALMFMISH